MNFLLTGQRLSDDFALPFSFQNLKISDYQKTDRPVMMFTDAQKTDIRRYCGYPALGTGASGMQGWRFFTEYGLLEYRMNNLSPSEETVVLSYLQTIEALEADIPAAADNLDTAQSAGWTHNPAELQQRTALLTQWRQKLCGFFGIPPGPALQNNQVRLIV